MALMNQPGMGIVREPIPMTAHVEFPKHMRHPGFQPGTPDEEVKLPGGKLAYAGGKSIRFPDVLVHGREQEEYHESLGYRSIGQSDPAAFARAVQAASPQAEVHQPVQYPKWVNGKIAHSIEDEAEILGTPIPETPAPVVVKTADQLRIETLEAQIATLMAKVAPLALNAEGSEPPTDESRAREDREFDAMKAAITLRAAGVEAPSSDRGRQGRQRPATDRAA